MTIGFILRTIAEVAVVAFLIWGFLHEDKFIRFEDRLARIVTVNIRRIRHRRMLKRQGTAPAVQPKPSTQTHERQVSQVSSAAKKPAAASASYSTASRSARRRRKKVSQNAA